MKEYIEKDAARDLMERALEDDWEIQYANDRLRDIPAADVVEVDVKDLRVKKAIKTLCEFYSTAKKSDYVQKPLAWALYQTWKSFDKMGGGVNDGGG